MAGFEAEHLEGRVMAGFEATRRSAQGSPLTSSQAFYLDEHETPISLSKRVSFPFLFFLQR
jgi:hypothetical protein